MANATPIGQFSLPGGTWMALFILVPLLVGSLLLLFPIHIVIALVVGLVALAYLVCHPAKCFQLVVFTIPFTERIRVLPISFSPNDLMILFCGSLVALSAFGSSRKVSMKTRLDPWIAVLTILFFLTGFFSESDRGILSFFKFVEAVIIYYMTVYLIRSKQLTRSVILKTVLVTALFQACLGILQSLTGGFGANFSSKRGYLGYLGLGSNTVWHGKGTMFHFNTLGNFLVTNFLLFLPIYHYVLRRKPWGRVVGAVLLAGIITTYSRGSLLGLIAGGLFFLWNVQKDQKRALGVILAVIIFGILPTIWYFGQSPYAETLSYNERLMVWQAPLAAITSSAKSLWLGSGLNSYEVVAWPYIPANVPMSDYHNWFAHNFYLLTVLELGIVGALIFFGFLVSQWIETWKTFKRTHGFTATYNLAMSVAIVSIFFISIFDHSYSTPYFKIYLFMLLGLLYVTPRSLSVRY